MVNKHPLDDTIYRARIELQDGIDKAMKCLQQGMYNYLSSNIDLSKLLEMVKGMGIPNIMGMGTTTMPGFDPYKILGLDKTATDSEIKKRYRELLNKLHPDVSGVKGTEFLTQMVVMAYNIIEKERGWK